VELEASVAIRSGYDEYDGTAGNVPYLVVQGLKDEAAPGPGAEAVIVRLDITALCRRPVYSIARRSRARGASAFFSRSDKYK
jgi:hypothetical protein